MGADINAQSEDGRTPLHMTAIHGRFTRSKTLIDHGKFESNLFSKGCMTLRITGLWTSSIIRNSEL
jgi:ankyrin repeat protein